MTDSVTQELWFEAVLGATTEKHLSSWERAMVLEGMDVPQKYEEQAAAGWPKRMPPFWIGMLQFFDEPQKQLALRSGLVAACARGSLTGLLHPDVVVIRGKHYRVDPLSKIIRLPTAQLLDEVTRTKAYKIDAEDAMDWFLRREIQPSEHIAAWFAACGLSVGSASTIKTPNHWAQLMPSTAPSRGQVVKADDTFAADFAKYSSFEIADMSPERLATLLTPSNLENLTLRRLLTKVVLHIDRVSHGLPAWVSDLKASPIQVAEWMAINTPGLVHRVHKTTDAHIDDPLSTGWRYHRKSIQGRPQAQGATPLTVTKFGRTVSAARQEAQHGMTRHKWENRRK